MAADPSTAILEACRAEAHRVMALLEEQLAVAIALTDPDHLDRVFVVHERPIGLHVEDSIFGMSLTASVPPVACWTDLGLEWVAAGLDAQLDAAETGG